jgi:hypothetical protein
MKLVLGKETPSILDQVSQQFEGLGPQGDLVVGAVQAPALQIKRESVEKQHIVRNHNHRPTP